jgi:ArsR family transcriptional regulator
MNYCIRMNGLTAQGSGLLERMVALTDPTRCRILAVLERHELSVGELCAVFQLPQSTVSRHLKVLTDEGWLTSRREATSRFYSMQGAPVDEAGARLWAVLREDAAAGGSANDDERRVKAVLGARASKSQEFFSSAADRWDRVREELFGPTFHLRALLALVDPDWTVGDLGCGTGSVIEALAPYVRRVVGVDAAAGMLDAGRRRLSGWPNVQLRQGDLEALPLGSGELDAAMLVLVLHHVAEPERVLAEAGRVVRADGVLMVVDMLPHDREEYRSQMGHVWMGFSHEQLRRLVEGAGFTRVVVQHLPVALDAMGPGLFVARASRAPKRTADRK